jgi:hypothetical protein
MFPAKWRSPGEGIPISAVQRQEAQGASEGLRRLWCARDQRSAMWCTCRSHDNIQADRHTANNSIADPLDLATETGFALQCRGWRRSGRVYSPCTKPRSNHLAEREPVGPRATGQSRRQKLSWRTRSSRMSLPRPRPRHFPPGGLTRRSGAAGDWSRCAHLQLPVGHARAGCG